MTKAELIELVAERSRLSPREAGRAVEATLALIEEALAAGGAINLSGFGKFHVGSRGARAGVHPRTGEPIWVAATRVPRFTAGSSLKKAVRTPDAPREAAHAPPGQVGAPQAPRDRGRASLGEAGAEQAPRDGARVPLGEAGAEQAPRGGVQAGG